MKHFLLCFSSHGALRLARRVLLLACGSVLLGAPAAQAKSRELLEDINRLHTRIEAVRSSLASPTSPGSPAEALPSGKPASDLLSQWYNWNNGWNNWGNNWNNWGKLWRNF